MPRVSDGHAPSEPVDVLRTRYAAVIFSMDGVVTDTAGVHARGVEEAVRPATRIPQLEPRSRAAGWSAEPSTWPASPRAHVDEQRRERTVRALLAARGAALLRRRTATQTRSPGLDRAGAGERQGRVLPRGARQHGVRVFDGTVALIGRLQDSGVPWGFVTASRNSGVVLAAAGLRTPSTGSWTATGPRRTGLPRKTPHRTPSWSAPRLLGGPRGRGGRGGRRGRCPGRCRGWLARPGGGSQPRQRPRAPATVPVPTWCSTAFSELDLGARRTTPGGSSLTARLTRHRGPPRGAADAGQRLHGRARRGVRVPRQRRALPRGQLTWPACSTACSPRQRAGREAPVHGQRPNWLGLDLPVLGRPLVVRGRAARVAGSVSCWTALGCAHPHARAHGHRGRPRGPGAERAAWRSSSAAWCPCATATWARKRRASSCGYQGRLHVRTGVDPAVTNSGVAEYRELNSHHLLACWTPPRCRTSTRPCCPSCARPSPRSRSPRPSAPTSARVR
ncbi:hypothetical protein QJS66_08795 [Kocuria rhizophila]|nr:hypothetical protein QJS66_08795 [Kocuria rhizophila]